MFLLVSMRMQAAKPSWGTVLIVCDEGGTISERKKTLVMQTNPFFAHLDALITQEEQSPAVTSLADLHAHIAARQAMEAELQTLVQFIQRTRERLQRLPKLPDLE